MADYYSTITNKGAELEAAATANGTTVNLTQFVITDGGGQLFNPDPALTVLPNEVYRGAISGKSVSQEQLSQIVLQLVLPAELPAGVDEFTVRGIGILTDAGELYAVGSTAAIEKPSSGVNVIINFRLAVSPTSDIVLVATTGDGLFLRQDANLADVKDAAEACENLGLKSAAFVEVQEIIGDEIEGRALLAGRATAENVGAVPTAGGEVGYLNNAEHYNIKDNVWPGGGSFQNQMNDPRALFYSANYVANGNVYLPMTKATVVTNGLGYRATISHGVLVSGNSDYPSYCIHISKEQGDGSFLDSTLIYNPNDGSLSVPGEARFGDATIGALGDVYGPTWGGWLSAWLGANTVTGTYMEQRFSQVQAWVQQYFVLGVQLGAAVTEWWPGGGGDAWPGHVLTGGDYGDDQSYARFKPFMQYIGGVWANIPG
ncbi:phage tail protein [Cedecea sp. S5-13]|uniref:phage tail protein n=1 Tax=Cedecea selenatireducens TaxID=3144416 RepID=UPI0035CCE9EA